ncbi:MAG: DUF2314 domain-containing protein [Opitutaceae bacterium]
MNLDDPIKQQCIDIAEFYHIDWYAGEFASVIWNKDTTDEFNLNALLPVHEDCQKHGIDWGCARSRIVNKLEEIQRRGLSKIGRPSWLVEAASSGDGFIVDGNLRWISGTDKDMGEAICRAQEEFLRFSEKLKCVDAEKSLIKAFFPHLADTNVGEHIYVTDPEIKGTTVCGTLWFEHTNIPGLESGQEVSVDFTRLSDWFYIVDGESFGGYTLPLLVKSMSEEELLEAKQSPPFCWYSDI